MIMNPMLVERVENALDEIRPALELDGGTVELIEITSGMVARLEFVGACAGCPLSALTLKLGVERLLKQRVPELAGIEAEGIVQPDWSAEQPLQPVVAAHQVPATQAP
jgi:Fe-S cluster biogenesis protein NfuA